MPQRPRIFRLMGSLLLLGLVCLLPFANSQSSPPQYALKVLSAKYLPKRDRIEYKLDNNGDASVTAYSIQVSVFVNGQDATVHGNPFGQSHDLLTPELFLQCQNAPENANDEDARPWPDDVHLPPGIIPPGKVVVRSILVTGLLDSSMLEHATPDIDIRVTGIIWSDGRIDGVSDVQVMQRMRDEWEEASYEEGQVLTVLKGHASDFNIQHRINEETKDLHHLMEGYPRERPIPSDDPRHTFHVVSPGVVVEMVEELDEAAYSPNPQARLSFLTDFRTCMHELRPKLQARAKVGP